MDVQGAAPRPQAIDGHDELHGLRLNRTQTESRFVCIGWMGARMNNNNKTPLATRFPPMLLTSVVPNFAGGRVLRANTTTFPSERDKEFAFQTRFNAVGTLTRFRASSKQLTTLADLAYPVLAR